MLLKVESSMSKPGMLRSRDNMETDIQLLKDMPEGTPIRCMANIWRYGAKLGFGKIYAVYLGWNECIDHPLIDTNEDDECYLEITGWEIDNE
jgi:hypothetical protein